MAYIRAMLAIVCAANHVRYCFLLLYLPLAGCADTAPVPPSKLVGPASALMVAPEPLSRVGQGDDLIQNYANLRRSYGRETGKLKRIQRWVRTATKK